MSLIDNLCERLLNLSGGKWLIVSKRNGLHDTYYIKPRSRFDRLYEHIVDEFDTRSEAEDELDRCYQTFRRAVGFSNIPVRQVSYDEFADIIKNNDYAVAKKDGIPEKYDPSDPLIYLAIGDKCVTSIEELGNGKIRVYHIESLEKGLGRKMIDYLKSKYNEISLHADGNQKLVNYYKSNGFELLDPKTNEMFWIRKF